MEKRLNRSRSKKVIGGVCGGLGDHLDIDPVILRIIFVLITIFHGIGILVYIIMWIVIPEEPYDSSFAEKKKEEPGEFKESKVENRDVGVKNPAVESNNSGGRIIFGVILIIVGLVFLSEKYFPFFDFEFVFAIGLIALGISLLFNFFNKPEKSS